MKLWIISQDANGGYDTYDAAIVAAQTEEEARTINPGGEWGDIYLGWCSSPKEVTVELIGTAIQGTEAGVILSSFNAG